MDKEKKGTEPLKTFWSISTDWFQQNNRSIVTLIKNYLCPQCAKQLSEKGKKDSLDVLMAIVKDCGSHTPGFINDRQPILESIFRFFLYNGNQPLDLEELGNRLSELRGGDSYRTSPETLFRLLKNDCYYGLREVQS